MRIAHALGWYFPDSVGGTEVYVEGLCRRVRAAGHEVMVAAPWPGHADRRVYEHDGVPVFRYGTTATPTREEANHRVATRGSEALHGWLADVRPDVLHVHSLTTGLGLSEIRAARRLGIRVIVTCHLPSLGYMCRAGELMQWGTTPCDGIVEAYKCAACALSNVGLPRPAASVAAAIPRRVSAVLKALPGRAGTGLGMVASIGEQQQMQRELFDLVEQVVVLNETARRMLVANGSPDAKVAVNRLGLSQPAVAAKPGPDRQPTASPVRFGYLGRLHPVKGIVELARAVASLPKNIRFRLEVRGPLLDDSARAMQATMQTILAGDDRVSFEPAVPAADVPRVLAEVDALICPSTWFENGPTVAIEAFAAGTPVIASRVGNLAELVQDGVNGRLVTTRDVAALSAAIAEAATNPAATIDHWRRHLPRARTMDDIARDYLRMYAA